LSALFGLPISSFYSVETPQPPGCFIFGRCKCRTRWQPKIFDPLIGYKPTGTQTQYPISETMDRIYLKHRRK